MYRGSPTRKVNNDVPPKITVGNITIKIPDNLLDSHVINTSIRIRAYNYFHASLREFARFAKDRDQLFKWLLADKLASVSRAANGAPFRDWGEPMGAALTARSSCSAGKHVVGPCQPTRGRTCIE